MGLDNFKSDENDNQSPDSGSAGNNSNSGNTQSNEKRDGNEKSQGGLESFRTSPSRGGSGGDNNQDNSDGNVLGINSREWNKMTVKQRVNEVRKRKIPDFRPDMQLDDRWSWEKAAKIHCVCGNVLYFAGKSTCSNCDREYAMTNRTVIKTSEPQDKVIHTDERKE